MALVQAENLTKTYGKGQAAVTALDHVSLCVEAGEFVAEVPVPECAQAAI